MLRNLQRLRGLLLPIFLVAVPHPASRTFVAGTVARTTTIFTGAKADLAMISPRFHELAVSADFDAGGGGIILVDQHTNRVIARTRTGSQALYGLSLDEAHGRIYGVDFSTFNTHTTLVGIDLATGHPTLHIKNPAGYVIASYGVDDLSGNIFLTYVTHLTTAAGLRQSQSVFAGYTQTGHRLFSKTTNDAASIDCIDGTHGRAILLGQSGESGALYQASTISARDTHSGQLLWTVHLVYSPRALDCDNRGAHALIVQPSGDISVLDTRTHQFGPRLTVPAAAAGLFIPPYGSGEQRVFINETTHTGLLFWSAFKDGIDFIDLRRHVRHFLFFVTTTASGCGHADGTGVGVDMTGANAKVVGMDESRGVAFVLYHKDTNSLSNTPPGVAAINMRTGTVLAKVAVSGSDLCAILAGDDQRVYVSESQTSTDPNTQQTTTVNKLVAIRPAGTGP